MAAFIYLRETEDWNNVSLHELTGLSHRKSIQSVIQMWDNRFPVRYFKYRAQIKDIALRQWPLPYITEFTQEIGDDDWFIPSDDDDWLHHDLPEFLENQTEEYVFWNTLVNMSCVKYNFHKWFSVHDFICSNNYAMKGSLVKRAIDNGRFGNILHCHAFSINIARDLGANIGEHKDKILSCYNYHPGSISALYMLIEKYGTIKGAMPAENPRKEYPDWIDPWHTELINIIEGLKGQITLM